MHQEAPPVDATKRVENAMRICSGCTFSGLIRTLFTNRYLFLVSHMRSNSTLLAHILGSHPGIIGYREIHIRYRTLRDLFKLKYRLCGDATTNNPIYLLDKILHNNLFIATKYLDSDRFRYLLMVREPERTIQSIVAMASKNGNARWDTPEKAGVYYIERLNGLLEMGRCLTTEKAIFLPSESIVDDTEKTIVVLQDWLQLQVPLSAKYKLFKHTGKPIVGDPSDNITSGSIRKQDANAYARIQVNQIILDAARQKHKEVVHELSAKFSNSLNHG